MAFHDIRFPLEIALGASGGQKDDALLGKITRVIDILALNIGFARRQ
ncbi:MAG: hypothetical protein KF765_07595 [Parvibaculaceae bacterium]|nr:hypothetical protein [Parvibaculaceae bacterium]